VTMAHVTTSEAAATRRVLIYRLGSMGDTVVSLPALYLIRRAFPGAERRLLTNFPVAAKAPPAAAILEHTGLVDGYFRYSVGTRSPRELFSLWWQLMRWRPEVLVHLGSSHGVYAGMERGVKIARRDALFFRLCGIRRLIGVPLTEEMQQNLSQGMDGTSGYEVLEPEAARLTRNIAELGNAHLEDAANWNLQLTEAEQARASDVLAEAGGRRLVAVSLGTKVQANEWQPERWRELLARIAERYPGHALALTGAGVDAEASEFVAAGWRQGSGQVQGAPAINLCGVLSPRESAAVFAKADVFLGHDSGPMHLAAAVQTPCVAIFSGRGRPRVWFPYGQRHRVLYHRVNCSGCHLNTCVVEQKKCIYSITVDEVFAQVQAVLDEPHRE
jgi:heptosyltransferase-3